MKRNEKQGEIRILLALSTLLVRFLEIEEDLHNAEALMRGRVELAEESAGRKAVIRDVSQHPRCCECLLFRAGNDLLLDGAAATLLACEGEKRLHGGKDFAGAPFLGNRHFPRFLLRRTRLTI